MTAPSQQSSRWGSLIQQAVAGVESRLDNILADGLDDQVSVQVIGKDSKSSSPSVSSKQISVSRGTSRGNKSNDRLQERLARAVAAKNVGPRADCIPSSTMQRRNSIVQTSQESRTCVEGLSDHTTDGQSDSQQVQTSRFHSPSETNDETEKFSNTVQPSNRNIKIFTELDLSLDTGEKISTLPDKSILSRQSKLDQKNMASPELDVAENISISSKTSLEYEALIKKLQSDLSVSEALRHEEFHEFTEKIDALQTKLRFIVKENADRARLTSVVASNGGGLEKKLADKEQQVALLLEEGLSLSKKELTYLTTIKKLRSQLMEEKKEADSARRGQEVLKNEVIFATERMKKMQVFEKQFYEQEKLISHLQNETELIKSENENNTLTITNLRSLLNESVVQNSKLDTENLEKSLKAEQRHVANLLNDIAALEAKKNSEADRAQSTIKELKEVINTNDECARAKILEMKLEQQLMEEKLEAMRIRAEKVSSGTTCDAQARLLRQIETLKTQYSIATENWQGIEASLNLRTKNLEKERDEAIFKEIDSRRRAQVAFHQLKSTESELEEMRLKVSSSQQELSNLKAKIMSLQKRSEEAEIKLVNAKTKFDKEIQSLKLDHQNHLAQEKQIWLADLWNTDSELCNRRDSSVTSRRKSLTSESVQSQSSPNHRSTARSVTYESAPTSYSYNCRPSSQPVRKSSGYSILSRQNSKTSLKEGAKFLSSLHDPDELFKNSLTSFSSLHNTHELESSSTIGDGPSVQLVERMSSAVRRLESEKVAMKEEITRLSTQRDEARAEITSIIGQLETKKNLDNQILELSNELKEVKTRYETTLLMLGEKSEEVDELRGDIQDIKSMYRDLVERTVK